MDDWTLDEFRDRLTRLLAEPRPWPRAQQRLVPELGYGRYRGPALPGARPAAVCVLFYPHRQQWHLPLTLRPTHLADHAGQVSLPGGVLEAGETDAQCALRELQEELGITVDEGRIVGRLSSIYVYSSHFRVQPVVAVVDQRPEFTPSAREVAALLEVPVSHLLDRVYRGSHPLTRRGFSCRAPHIDFHGHRIWGATAVILSELICILEAVFLGTAEK